jgi:hypothetical protein
MMIVFHCHSKIQTRMSMQHAMQFKPDQIAKWTSKQNISRVIWFWCWLFYAWTSCHTQGSTSASPWTPKLSKMMQPELDYISPDVQLQRRITCESDVFSLGLLICTLYNSGRSLIQAMHNTTAYVKQIEQVPYGIMTVWNSWVLMYVYMITCICIIVFLLLSCY